MAEPTNLTQEKLRQSLAECVRICAELDIEIKKSQFLLARSRVTRGRRQRQKGRTAPRLKFVTR